MKMNHRQKGFTLAEMAISVAVVGVIASYIVPKLVMSTGNNLHHRHDRATEFSGVLQEVMNGYTQENGVCYSGISCKIDSESGSSVDGLLPWSYPNNNPAPYNRLNTYIKNRMPLGEEVSAWSGYDYRCYQFNKDDVFCFTGISAIAPVSIQQTRHMVTFSYFSNRTLNQVSNDQFSFGGVDSHVALLVYIPEEGRLLQGLNMYSRWMDPTASYDPNLSSIYDWQGHPEDTCSSLEEGYGSMCDIN